jgi:isopenicillin N synthase-like dioxygenase
MIVYTPPKPAEFIPVIDLAPSFNGDSSACKAVAWEIHKAARDTGFFYISGHGISASGTKPTLPKCSASAAT